MAHFPACAWGLHHIKERQPKRHMLFSIQIHLQAISERAEGLIDQPATPWQPLSQVLTGHLQGEFWE